ncbi:MAG TPA: branched-chain amino acid ABC transporter permease [Pseudonocardiaceae bacterium]|jgi:branched-chain amino acid transport system permease protein|nr:branched-chain amino acid ABC transporter permease [Pseudonocardiaceae bacterium]
MDRFLSAVGSSVGDMALYSFIALAWVVIYRATKVLNFATGEFVVIGAFLAADLMPNHELLSILASVVVLGTIGALTYVVLIRPFDGRPDWEPVIVSMGFAFVLDGVIAIAWGNSTASLAPPIAGTLGRLGFTPVTWLTLAAVLVVLLVVALLLVFLNRSRTGIRLRAAAEAPVLAEQSAIRLPSMFVIGWGASAALAALAGIYFAFSHNVIPSSTDLAILGITPVLLGGLDSLVGAVVGSVITALALNIASLYWGDSSQQAVSGALVLLVLIIRPSGLFGSKRVARV